MYLTQSILLSLPVLALAEQQQPLMDKAKAWFSKAQSYIPSAVPSVPVPSNPVEAGASKVAEHMVHPLTLDNWQDVLKADVSSAKIGPEPWMVFLTGGNKTCYGMCEQAEKAWNASTPILAASSNPPKLASLDCDEEQILCNVWASGPPGIYYMLLPAPLPDQSKPSTTVYYLPLNRTSVKTQDIVKLHTEEKYKVAKPYEGYWHPFDSILATTGAALPIAWGMWALAKMPNWLPMILVSFMSRTFLGRRAQPGQAAGGAQPAPAGGQ
ncbi:hypothetical protein K402DRAFT_388897 [Aulographum hederae CBS 113979]|uniref:Uncharacterized protein n=1 Tax=Aulographum hederae CBS 113979 TaxID=1176131 RepID=A0A6G1HEY5_9PEZI|nr:hypothetical protein K402DRAFT_388897 [Aulographum hederae CBS 113979]